MSDPNRKQFWCWVRKGIIYVACGIIISGVAFIVISAAVAQGIYMFASVMAASKAAAAAKAMAMAPAAKATIAALVPTGKGMVAGKAMLASATKPWMPPVLSLAAA